MNGLPQFLNHPVILKWGWVLLHFLWQGALLSVLAWMVLSLCAGQTARLRSLLATGCLFLMPVCPLVTWFMLDEPDPPGDTVPVTVIQNSVSPAPPEISESVPVTPLDGPPTEAEFPAGDPIPVIPQTASLEPSAPSNRESASSVPVWTSRLERGLPWFVAAWCCGVVLLSIRLAGGWMFARHCVTQGHPLRDPWTARVEQLVVRLKLSRTICWIESSRIRVPQAMGWWKPVVLVPGSLLTTLSPAEIECLLLHELMHIRRHDFIVNLIQCAIETIFFYHPGVLWLSRRVRLERELACDEAVVALTDDRVTFSRALLSLADHAQLPRPALAATESDLTARIRTVLGLKRKGSTGGIAVWVCLAACAIALGVLLVPDSQASSRRDQPAETAETDREAALENKPDEDGQDEPPRVHMFGKVVDAEGKPVAGADVHTSLGGQKYSTVSGAGGEFSLDVPRPGPLYNVKSMLVFAAADKGHLQGTAYIAFGSKDDKPADPTEITLQPAREFGIVVRDHAGEPVSGATVKLVSSKFRTLDEETSDAGGRALLVVPADLPLGSIVAFKKGVGIDTKSFDSRYGSTNIKLYSRNAENPAEFTLQPCRPVTVHVVDDQQRPVPGARVSFRLVKGIPEFSGLSDDEGNVTFDLAPWNLTGAHFISVGKQGYLDPGGTYFHPEAASWVVTAELVAKIRVKGQVTMPDGRPAADAEVRASGRNYTGPHPELFDLARTNADGRFEFLLPPMEFYSFLASQGDFISRSKELIIYEQAPAEPLRLQLVAATRVRGRVTGGERREPAGNQRIGFALQPQQAYSDLAGDRKLPDPEHDSSRWSLNPTHHWGTTTDPQGQFEVMLGPGTYLLSGTTPGKPYEFTVGDERELELDVHFPGMTSRKPAPARRDAPPEDSVPLAGRVVSKDDPKRGIPNVPIQVLPLNEYTAPYRQLKTDADGRFAIQRAPEGTTYIWAELPYSRQAALIAVEPADVTVDLSLQPLTSVTGRLIDARTGLPLGDERLKCAIEFKTGKEFAPIIEILVRTAKTESDGSFTIEGLLPGRQYVLRADRIQAQTSRDRVWVRVGQVTPQAGDKPLDMGDLKFETHRPVSAETESAGQDAAIMIIAEPKSVRPFEWKVGGKVTVGVRCVSADNIRVIGVATDVRLVAAKDFDNRTQLALKTTPEMAERIRQAAKMSEYWFEIMPFQEAHRRMLKSDAELSDFLKKNPAYRPADSQDWGIGARGGRVKPPAGDELPNRK